MKTFHTATLNDNSKKVKKFRPPAIPFLPSKPSRKKPQPSVSNFPTPKSNPALPGGKRPSPNTPAASSPNTPKPLAPPILAPSPTTSNLLFLPTFPHLAILPNFSKKSVPAASPPRKNLQNREILLKSQKSALFELFPAKKSLTSTCSGIMYTCMRIGFTGSSSIERRHRSLLKAGRSMPFWGKNAIPFSLFPIPILSRCLCALRRHGRFSSLASRLPC